MRTSIGCLCQFAVMFSFGVLAQTAPSFREGSELKPNGGPRPPLTAGEFRLLTIEHLMQQPSPLAVGSAQLHRLGDQAAVDIIKVVGNGQVGDVQIPTIIDMIRKAFERPAAILDSSNRRPMASLFLLRVFKSTTQSDAIRARIDDTRQFLQTMLEGK